MHIYQDERTAGIYQDFFKMSAPPAFIKTSAALSCTFFKMSAPPALILINAGDALTLKNVHDDSRGEGATVRFNYPTSEGATVRFNYPTSLHTLCASITPHRYTHCALQLPAEALQLPAEALQLPAEALQLPAEALQLPHIATHTVRFNYPTSLVLSLW